MALLLLFLLYVLLLPYLFFLSVNRPNPFLYSFSHPTVSNLVNLTVPCPSLRAPSSSPLFLSVNRLNPFLYSLSFPTIFNLVGFTVPCPPLRALSSLPLFLPVNRLKPYLFSFSHPNVSNLVGFTVSCPCLDLLPSIGSEGLSICYLLLSFVSPPFFSTLFFL